MQISYQKDFNYSYLVIQAEQEVDMETYPVRMLLGNSIDALVPCKIQTLNGRKELYYEITSLQSVAAQFSRNKIREPELRELMLGFVKAIASIQSFLMDVNQLVVLPEYMYYHKEKDILQFCYLPGYNKEIQGQFRGFLEYLLPLIDHQDSGAVVMGYGIYRQTMEESFSLDQIKEYVYKEYQEERQEQEPASELNENENCQQTEQNWKQEVVKECETEKETGKHPASWELVLSSAAWTIVLLGICILRYLGYLPFLTFPMLLGIFIAVLGILAVNTRLQKRHKADGKNPSEQWRQKAVSQASIQWPGQKAVEPEEIREIYDTKEQNISASTGFSDQKGQNDFENVGFFRRESQEDSINSSFSDSSKEEKQGDSYVELGDTQPLSKLNLPKQGRLMSKDPERLPDIELMGDLTDLNSRNGTYLNGKQIPGEENCRIVPGDEISFADAEYTFHIT